MSPHGWGWGYGIGGHGGADGERHGQEQSAGTVELCCRKMNLTAVHYANTGVFMNDPKILQTDPEDQVCLGVP